MNDYYNKIRDNIYYIIVFIVSFIALVFLPFCGSKIGLELDLPKTKSDWIVFILTKVIISVVNMLIYLCFMKQGKDNVRNDKRYIDAMKIMNKTIKERKKKCINPYKWMKFEYIKKGTLLFITTLLTTLAFSQALISYDYMALISYIFVIAMSCIFGIIQMKKVEEVWTDGFLEYANYKLLEAQNGDRNK